MRKLWLDLARAKCLAGDGWVGNYKWPIDTVFAIGALALTWFVFQVSARLIGNTVPVSNADKN